MLDSEVGCDCFQMARRSWSQFAANNAGTYAYEATVLQELAAEGHQLVLGTTISRQEARTLRQQVRMTCDATVITAARRVQAAAVITVAEAQRLEAQQSQHFEQQQQLIKYHLFQRYGLEITDELYLRDQCGWYPKVLLDYYLGPGRDFLKLRDQLKCQELVHQGLAWEPDVNRTLLSTSVAMLEHLQLPALLQKAEFTNSDPDLQAFQQAAIQQRRTIKLGLNLTIREGEKPDTPIQVFSQFLEKLGRKLVCRRKQGGRGQQERVYTIDTVDEIWHAKAERLARASNSTPRVLARWEIFALDDGRAATFFARAEAAKVYLCNTVVTPGNQTIYSLTVDETFCHSRSDPHSLSPRCPVPASWRAWRASVE